MLRLIISLSLLICFNFAYSQSSFSVLFYNTENLFDCENDSLKNDDEFTPDGDKHWHKGRYYRKIHQVAGVIAGANKWDVPELIGLCEVENAKVLKDLIFSDAIKQIGYQFIHFDSPDFRGIDVALLYNKNAFTPLQNYPIPLGNTDLQLITRDALYVKGVINARDTLHIIVNHWPSKRGGELHSEKNRLWVSDRIGAFSDSILAEHPKAKIIVMGDFNAELDSPSIISLIKNRFTNTLDHKLLKGPVQGTHKYQGQWSSIDHIFTSQAFDNEYSIDAAIIQNAHMLEEDIGYSGVKPKRTYAGPRYIGGFSDHLPVLVTFTSNEILDSK